MTCQFFPRFPDLPGVDARPGEVQSHQVKTQKNEGGGGLYFLRGKGEEVITRTLNAVWPPITLGFFGKQNAAGGSDPCTCT